MSELEILIVAIISDIILYPKLRKGIIYIKRDIEALIRELGRRR